MKKIIPIILFSAFFSLYLIKPSYAVCPVCVVAVGAGVGLSRWLGISDIISGLWLGAFLTAITFWTTTLLSHRKLKFKFMHVTILVLYYILAFFPLHVGKIIGHPFNRIFGIDKLFAGSAIGTLLFYSSVFIDKTVRYKNGGKVKIYYQKVIIPVLLLLLVSIIFFVSKI